MLYDTERALDTQFRDRICRYAFRTFWPNFFIVGAPVPSVLFCFCVCMTLRTKAFARSSSLSWTWRSAFRCSYQLLFERQSPKRVTEVLESTFALFGVVIVFGIFITAYGVAGYGWWLEEANDTIDKVLLIYVGVPGLLFSWSSFFFVWRSH